GEVAAARWPGCRGSLRVGTREPDAIGVDRRGDVLQRLLAYVLERKTESLADRIADAARDADTARLGQAFEPRSDIDAVAEDVLLVVDHVAEVDPDSVFDALGLRHAGIVLGHAALHLDRAAHGVNDRGEFDERAIAGQLDEPA